VRQCHTMPAPNPDISLATTGDFFHTLIPRLCFAFRLYCICWYRYILERAACARMEWLQPATHTEAPGICLAKNLPLVRHEATQVRLEGRVRVGRSRQAATARRGLVVPGRQQQTQTRRDGDEWRRRGGRKTSVKVMQRSENGRVSTVI
jgi:hypothetical protein